MDLRVTVYEGSIPVRGPGVPGRDIRPVSRVVAAKPAETSPAEARMISLERAYRDAQDFVSSDTADSGLGVPSEDAKRALRAAADAFAHAIKARPGRKWRRWRIGTLNRLYQLAAPAPDEDGPIPDPPEGPGLATKSPAADPEAMYAAWQEAVKAREALGKGRRGGRQCPVRSEAIRRVDATRAAFARAVAMRPGKRWREWLAVRGGKVRRVGQTPAGDKP